MEKRYFTTLNTLLQFRRSGPYKGKRSILHHISDILDLLDLLRAGLHRHDNDVHRSRYAQQKDHEART